jgi:hypothetical protein
LVNLVALRWGKQETGPPAPKLCVNVSRPLAPCAGGKAWYRRFERLIVISNTIRREGLEKLHGLAIARVTISRGC